MDRWMALSLYTSPLYLPSAVCGLAHCQNLCVPVSQLPDGLHADNIHLSYPTGTATAGDGDLPSVMTCANYIKLPAYSSKQVSNTLSGQVLSVVNLYNGAGQTLPLPWHSLRSIDNEQIMICIAGAIRFLPQRWA